ncbi:tetratricopeptide repeat protein [Virgibacillus halophilus]|uniref:Tetratricopeptide repeat protein n=1 Tax=Tigheibacillus halophilus TaxID=361280 RepID=A0ABU5CE28_9BACI|nr:tetratricopeptide repeat protein [Virgibacillus halophilus]
MSGQWRKKLKKSFQKAIDLGLNEADVFYMLGMTFQKQSQYKLSLPYLQRASELDEDDEEILFQYGLSLAQVDEINMAKAVFHQVIDLNDQHSDAHYNLGVIALYQEEPEVSLNHFNAALAAQPDHLLAVNGKKKVEEFLEKYDG